MSKSLKEKIEDLFELEEIEDFDIADTDDPDVVVITIKGRLREDFDSDVNHSDYDRAMKGITPYEKFN